MMNTSNFSQTYVESRQRFRDQAQATGAHLKTILIGENKLYGPEKEELSIDIAIQGPEQGPTLVLSSGLHGIEGYCGSGIQLAALQKSYPPELKRIFIHAINPYGMAHLRRVNENNVDLNRNFIFNPSEFTGCNEGYRQLNSLLNPATPYKGFEPLMLLKTLWTIIQKGIPTLKQAVASGQYEYPKGLFFGGNELQEGPRKLMEFLPTAVNSQDPIVHIDFHTGLGDFGDYALLLEATETSDLYKEMLKCFGERIQPWQAGEGVAYSISGGFPAALQNTFRDQIRVLTCEFGTYAPRKVIEAMTAENRAHFYGGQKEQAKAQFKEIFYPQSQEWQNEVLSKGLFVVDQALSYLSVSK